MSVFLVLALVSQLVLVYVSVPVSAFRECSPRWYVSVSVSGGFWHFFALVYWTSPLFVSFCCFLVFLIFSFPLHDNSKFLSSCSVLLSDSHSVVRPLNGVTAQSVSQTFARLFICFIFHFSLEGQFSQPA